MSDIKSLRDRDTMKGTISFCCKNKSAETFGHQEKKKRG